MPIVGTPLNGLIAKGFVSPGGMSTPTWGELDTIGDVTLNSVRNNSPVKERGSLFEKQILGQHVLDVTFTLTRRIGNPEYEALRNAHLSGEVVGVAFMTGDVAAVGSEGWQFDAVVTDFVVAEPIDDASTVEVTVKPAIAGLVEPEYVIVAVMADSEQTIKRPDGKEEKFRVRQIIKEHREKREKEAAEARDKPDKLHEFVGGKRKPSGEG